MSKKILGIGLAIAGAALMFTGIGAPLGMLATSGLLASVSVASVVGMGLMVASSVLMGPAKPKALHTSPTDRLQATLDPTTPRKIALGITALANDVRYQAFTGAKQEYLEQIICHASHEVQSIDEFWIGNELAWTLAGGAQGRYNGYLTVTPRTVGTSANGIAIDGTWTSACTLTGCAYSRVKFKLTGNTSKTQSPFSGGVDSRTTWRGKGAKLYNPRLDSTVAGGSGSHRANDQSTWTWDANACRNPALQELFYELGWKINGKLAVGKGVPPARIDLPSFITSANLCDEAVALNGGGTEPRYRGDGIVSEADDPSAIREHLCQAMNAVLRDAGGKLSLEVLHNDLSTPVTPYGRTAFDQRDILSSVQWDQTPGLSSTFNVVRGRRVDPSNSALYQLVDVPEVRIASPDGIERIDTIELPFVQSNGQAQRLFKQRLQRNQYQGRFAFTGGPAWWGVSLGNVVPISLPTFGWAAKLFRVAHHKQSRGGPVELVLLEENAAIYQWDNDEAAPVVAGAPTIYDPLNNPILISDTIELFDGASLGNTSVVIDPPPLVVIYADSAGTPKASELPRTVQLTASAGSAPSAAPSTSVVGAKAGVAPLDAGGKVPIDYLPDGIGGIGLAPAFFDRWAGTAHPAGSTFTLSESVAAASDILVAINGLLQDPSVDYTIVGTTLTLTSALLATDILIAQRTGGATGAAGGGGGGGSGTVTSVSIVAANSLSGTVANATTAPAITLDIAVATTSAKGAMSAADKTKLDAITGTNTGDQFTNVTSSRLLGRYSAGFGVAQEIALGSSLSVSGGTLNVTFTSSARLLGRSSAGSGNAEEIQIGVGLQLLAGVLSATGGGGGGGSGPWTETTLGADYNTTSTAFADITDGTTPLVYTPPANSYFELEAVLLMQSAATVNVPRVGVHVDAQGASAYGAIRLFADDNADQKKTGTFTTAAADVQMVAGGLPFANSPYLVTVRIRGRSGASPAAIRLQMAAELNTSTCSILAGSQMRTKAT